MEAVRFHGYGAAGVLRREQVDRPAPGPGHVLVRVAGTSFNPVDAAIRAGHLQQVFPLVLPHTPGLDVAGTVAAMGAGPSRFAVGSTVIGFLAMTADGASAEYVLAPDEALAAAPATVALADAAALPTVGLTAWQALFDHADVQPGQRVLVHGAGGAVGGYAVQLARQAGAKVLATAGPRNLDRIRGYGADRVVDHTTERAADEVAEPLDAVLNLAPVPPGDLAALARLVRPGGVLVTTVPGPSVEATGVRSVSMFLRRDAEQLTALVDRVDQGELHLHVAERVGLIDLADVHARAEAGALAGKTVVTA